MDAVVCKAVAVAPRGDVEARAEVLGVGERVALIFKNEVQETWVGGLTSTDGLIFHGEPRLVYPKHAKLWPRQAQGVMTHNLAIAQLTSPPSSTRERAVQSCHAVYFARFTTHC